MNGGYTGTTDNFAVVTNESYMQWNKIDLPTFEVDKYFMLPGNYHYISVGLFGYDTYYLQMYAPDDYKHFFESGKYDGWSMGSIIYFEYYQFDDQ